MWCDVISYVMWHNSLLKSSKINSILQLIIYFTIFNNYTLKCVSNENLFTAKSNQIGTANALQDFNLIKITQTFCVNALNSITRSYQHSSYLCNVIFSMKQKWDKFAFTFLLFWGIQLWKRNQNFRDRFRLKLENFWTLTFSMLPSQTRIPVNLKLLEEIFKAAKKC